MAWRIIAAVWESFVSAAMWRNYTYVACYLTSGLVVCYIGVAAMLEVRRVSKQFLGIPAVDDVSFSARAGEITGYRGPNGSEKPPPRKIIPGLRELPSVEILF